MSVAVELKDRDMPTWDGIRHALCQIAEECSEWAGLPIPVEGNDRKFDWSMLKKEK